MSGVTTDSTFQRDGIGGGFDSRATRSMQQWEVVWSATAPVRSAAGKGVTVQAFTLVSRRRTVTNQRIGGQTINTDSFLDVAPKEDAVR